MPRPLSAIVHSSSPCSEGLSLLLPRTAHPLWVMEVPEHSHPVAGQWPKHRVKDSGLCSEQAAGSGTRSLCISDPPKKLP